MKDGQTSKINNFIF